jgi:CHAT domain-containing protein/Tfp pilus assembly protein PilF
MVHLRVWACAIMLACLLPPRSDDTYLLPGKPVRQEPPLDRTYLVASGSRAFITLTVEQHDADVSITYRLPGSDAWNQIDSWEYGDEVVSAEMHANETMAFHVRVKIKHAAGAFYTVRLENPRPPEASDQLWLEGERLASAVKASLDDGPANPERNLEAGLRVSSIWRQLKEPQLEASGIVQTGNVLFTNGRITEALAAFLSAFDLSTKYRDASNMAESANDAGYCELLLGQLTAASGHLARALKIWEDIGSSYGRQTALNNIGLMAWQTGDFARARRMYQEVLRLASRDDHRTRGLLANNIGLIFLSLGDYQQSIANLRQSIELIPQGDTTARARTMINLGRAYRLSGDSAGSIDWLERALPLARKAPDPRVLAETLNNLGQSLAASQPAAAESDLRQALGIYRTASDQRGSASALHNIGLVRAARDDPAGGLALLQQALQLRLQAGLRDDAADTLSALAQVNYHLGKFDDAARYSARALETIESLRSSLPGEQFRIGYFSAKQSFYDFYIDLLMRMHHVNPAAGFDRQAFNIAEHARGRALLEMLREARADITGGVDPSLLEQERSIRQSLGFLSRELTQLEETRHTREREAALRARLQMAVDAYRDIEAEIRDKSPEYANLIFPQPRPLAEIQATALAGNTALLEFSLGADRSYLWLITRNSFTTYELPGQAILLPLCDNVRALAASYRGRVRDAGLQRRYLQSVHSLSSALLGQVAGTLTGRRLLIVTPGLLQQVPFAALSISGSNARDALPLGVTNEIERMTSASAFLEMRDAQRGRRPPSSGVAVFADPVFDQFDHRLPSKVRRKAAIASNSLSRLPFSGQEAAEILRLFPGKNNLRAVGFAASRSNLFQPGIGNFWFIHFGTHAVIDPTPELSGIALSQWTEDGMNVDGFVRTPDIYNLPKLSCTLVVLAGCDTGSGTEVNGEGVIGLTRGFLYAGARSVLVDLWSLEEGPFTVEVMRVFYTKMVRSGLTPVAALRATREEFWNRGGRWRDDYFQAGLELYGDSEP